MTENKHTPGPWRITRVNGIPHAIMAPDPDLGGYGICLLVVGREFEANARLIAASPVMLQTLRSAETAIEASISYYGSDAALAALRDVRAAIARAEGEP